MMRQVLLTLATMLLAACCQSPLKLVLAAEAADLKPLIEKALNEAPGASMAVEVAPAGTQALHNVLLLSSAPNFDVTDGSDPIVPFASDWDSTTYSAPAALTRLGRQPDGKWKAIPVLFDVVGRTSFVLREGELTPPAPWPLVGASTRPDSLVIAGARPSLRQAAYFFQNGALGHAVDLSTWFTQSAEASRKSLDEISGWSRAPGWRRDTWKFQTADVLNEYRPERSLQYAETFRDFEKANPAGFRRFNPITSGSKNQTVSGLVLFLEWHGDASMRGQAEAAARALNSQGFLKDAGSQTKWLAVNQRAYEIDPTGAAVREVVWQAQDLIPVTDRLPQPLVENNLLVQIQLAFDRVR